MISFADSFKLKVKWTFKITLISKELVRVPKYHISSRADRSVGGAAGLTFQRSWVRFPPWSGIFFSLSDADINSE